MDKGVPATGLPSAPKVRTASELRQNSLPTDSSTIVGCTSTRAIFVPRWSVAAAESAEETTSPIVVHATLNSTVCAAATATHPHASRAAAVRSVCSIFVQLLIGT